MHHHRIGSGGGVPLAPPPPLLSSVSSRRTSGSRTGGRSRSRSPPRGSGGPRYRNERDVRDRDRERERDRGGRERERRRSVSPLESSSRTENRDRSGSGAQASNTKTVSSDNLPSISLIQPDVPAAIIRRIMNPEEVKIPRRVNEGSKPIFDREELKEAMRRRIMANDNEENPPQTNVYIQETTPVTQQRVVAIIREPVGANDLFPNFTGAAAKPEPSSSGTGRIHRITPDSPLQMRPSGSSGFNRRSPSPKDARRRISPPPSASAALNRRRSRSRSLERERERERLIMMERERDRDRGIQRLIADREREQVRVNPASVRERLPPSERPRDMRDMDVGRGGIGVGVDRDHHRRGPDMRNELERERNRGEREKPSRFGPPSQAHPLMRRSRSPISRVPREDLRMRRRSRSHSVTPPPMPEEIRRQIIERQRNIDLRSSLSRQPGKFGPDDRSKGRPGPGGAPFRGGRGGRGGFARVGRGREDERRIWVHDMFEDDQPKKG